MIMSAGCRKTAKLISTWPQGTFGRLSYTDPLQLVSVFIGVANCVPDTLNATTMKNHICLFGSAFLVFVFATVVFHVVLWYFVTSEVSENCAAVKATETSLTKSDATKLQMYQKFVNMVNEGKYPWKAKIYSQLHMDHLELEEFVFREISDLGTTVFHLFHPNETYSSIVNASVLYVESLDSSSIALPEHFDARLQWPMCASLHNIKNQGSCGSCWAESVSGVIADRLCIASNGFINVEISSQDLIECCTKCFGCHGSDTHVYPFEHWVNNGVVTGGRYKSNEGCKPFKFPSHCGTPCSMEDYEANPETGENCVRECRKGYAHTYEQDKYFGSAVYFIGFTEFDDAFNVSFETVQRRFMVEIATNGPVSFCFNFPESILIYDTGVFSSINANFTKYGHCAKIIGWGMEHLKPPGVKLYGQSVTNVPYWIVANSWGRDWGEKGLDVA